MPRGPWGRPREAGGHVDRACRGCFPEPRQHRSAITLMGTSLASVARVGASSCHRPSSSSRRAMRATTSAVGPGRRDPRLPRIKRRSGILEPGLTQVCRPMGELARLKRRVAAKCFRLSVERTGEVGKSTLRFVALDELCKCLRLVGRPHKLFVGDRCERVIAEVFVRHLGESQRCLLPQIVVSLDVCEPKQRIGQRLCIP